MHAEIYGPSLMFESKYRNLGFWSSPEDRAQWRLQPKSAGEYVVSLDYACPPQARENRVRVTVNGQVLVQEIAPSGSWDQYVSMRVGKVSLPAEPVRLTVESDGDIDGYLFDLRTVPCQEWAAYTHPATGQILAHRASFGCRAGVAVNEQGSDGAAIGDKR